MTQPLPSRNKLIWVDPTGQLKLREYRLTVLDGPDAKKTLVVSGSVVIGNHPDCGFVLSDPTVSRRHAELVARRDGLQLRDLDSKNGTFVAGARVREAMLDNNAMLILGQTTIAIGVIDESIGVEESITQFGEAVGHNAAMQRLFGMLKRVAQTDATVVLEGETGTGKEVLAAAIHAESPRANGPFVVLDCASINAERTESELFGHVAGAFTGALTSREGAFRLANGGTLLVDNIDELPLELQPKLLRALESRTIRSVGDSADRPIDVRVLVSSTHDLEREVRANRFRADLFFRLGGVKAVVPPLRERADDVPYLVAHFLKQLGQQDFQLSQTLKLRLAAHHWPGNVRELRNIVERFATGIEDPALASTPSMTPEPSTAHPLVSLPLREAKERLVDAFTKEYVEALLQRAGGNVTAAAKMAKVGRTYLHRLVARYHLRRTD